jgi:hypothetical protein
MNRHSRFEPDPSIEDLIRRAQDAAGLDETARAPDRLSAQSAPSPEDQGRRSNEYDEFFSTLGARTQAALDGRPWPAPGEPARAWEPPGTLHPDTVRMLIEDAIRRGRESVRRR